ncbi:MAG TPA: hypothetical protein VMG59_02130 [Phycisphaerae bacterium]|nr:hypothetical protein [Phycisphaerae bacterium]
MSKGIAIGFLIGVLIALAGGAGGLLAYQKFRPQVTNVQTFTWNNFIMLSARKGDVEYVYMYGGNGSSALRQNWNIVSAVDLDSMGAKSGLHETMQIGDDTTSGNQNTMLNEFRFLNNGNP